MNPYTILQVSPQATDFEIKKQFRKLAQEHHPDKGGDPEKFKEINLAYSILSDPDRRKHFDATGEYNMSPNIKEEALSCLANVFNHYVNQMNPELENLVVLMKNDINMEKDRLGKVIPEAIEVVTKLEKVLKKIKKKKKGDNLLKQFALQRIKEQEANISQLNRRLELMTRMLTILEDYGYGDEEFDMLSHFSAQPNGSETIGESGS